MPQLAAWMQAREKNLARPAGCTPKLEATGSRLPAARNPPPDNAQMRTLESPGLTLAPQLPAHAEAMFAVLADLAQQPFGSAAPVSLDALQQRFARLALGWSPDGRQQWLNWVVQLPDGALVGYVQATIGADRHASIGYELAPTHWGRGIGTRAAALMIDELVGHYRIQGLHASLHPDNHRSMRLLRRLGFVPLRPELLAAGQAMPAHDEGDRVMVCPRPWRGAAGVMGPHPAPTREHPEA